MENLFLLVTAGPGKPPHDERGQNSGFPAGGRRGQGSSGEARGSLQG